MGWPVSRAGSGRVEGSELAASAFAPADVGGTGGTSGSVAAAALDGVSDRPADGSEPGHVSRILLRLKLSRVRDLEPRPVSPPYEHAAPGDLLHLDIKKLGRIVRPSHRVTGNGRDSASGAGWEYVHVAIDDHSRIAFSALHPDEKAESTVAFLHQALAYYARLGIQFRAILTDNGPAYRALAVACRMLGLKHRFTRPYTPRTNGKAERFIQTALREWAYLRSCQDSNERSQEFRSWLHQYNWHRPHKSLGLSPPISRSELDRNNLLRLTASHGLPGIAGPGLS